MKSIKMFTALEARGSSKGASHRRLLSLLFVFSLLATTSCQQPVYYQPKQTNLKEEFKDISKQLHKDNRYRQKDMALFLDKCSSCHQANRALSVIKDPMVWDMTIKRMQNYSKGSISDLDAQEIVDFHVTQQQKEIDNFKETCTKCHDDERINKRSMSEDQWLETIKRMQKKAPELITDEKVILLAAYFHRREFTLARIFYGRCRLCHLESSGGTPPPDSTKQLDGLIALANEEFGESLQIKDVNSLLSTHIERQKNDMQLYEDKCNICHNDELPIKADSDRLRGTGNTG